MKRFVAVLFTGLLLAILGLASAWAQPSPLDSIILESKTVAPGLAAPNATDTSALVYMKMWITNKDSLSNISLPYVERSVCQNAYMIVGRPRNNFNNTVNRLTSTLPGSLTAIYSRYNSTSPDSVTLSAFFDPTDIPGSAEPPNIGIRKAFWELKFDSTSIEEGQVEIDSIKILTVDVQFVDITGFKVKPNWVKAVFTIGAGCTTAVQEINPGQRPQSYSLSQNYPNPFNANTQISFALPKAGKTKLEIFNILGQKVNTLVDEYMNAGYKIVNWDGRDERGMEVPSGIYFYRLRSENFLQTKKMLMIQ